jgi:hypothetical protein
VNRWVSVVAVLLGLLVLAPTALLAATSTVVLTVDGMT